MTTITLPRATVEQALEALEAIREADTAGATPKMVVEARKMYEPTITALSTALARQAEPVATITECEACFTPDVCQLRGTCDHYAASQLRVAAQPKPPAEPDAYGYASRLAVAIWEQHYKGEAPDWKPLADLMGVLTQIDNMTSGLTRQEQAEPVREPAFHGFMSADGTRVDLCFTPSSPRSDGTYATAYYTAPPQRKPLTEEEIDAMWRNAVSAEGFTTAQFVRNFVRDVERALEEKNRGR